MCIFEHIHRIFFEFLDPWSLILLKPPLPELFRKFFPVYLVFASLLKKRKKYSPTLTFSTSIRLSKNCIIPI